MSFKYDPGFLCGDGFSFITLILNDILGSPFPDWIGCGISPEAKPILRIKSRVFNGFDRVI